MYAYNLLSAVFVELQLETWAAAKDKELTFLVHAQVLRACDKAHTTS